MKDSEVIFLTPVEAMERLKVGRNAMYEDLLKRKDFPCMRIGKKFYINSELLEEWARKECSKQR